MGWNCSTPDAQDIGQRVKSKFGYTSNSSREKDDMARSVGGIGQKNAEGTKISSSMNKDYAAERAKKAHQAYLGKNDIVDKNLENNNGGTST